MTYKSLKMIAVSKENYLILKRLGRAGDSFNDVITEVLKQRNLQTDPIRGPTQMTRMRRMQIQPRWSMIIPNMNNYISANQKLCAISVSSHQKQQIPKPTVVTMCLTDGHEECTGTYVDATNSFKIHCKCKCHVNRYKEGIRK
jgi:hypothetical protein